MTLAKLRFNLSFSKTVAGFVNGSRLVNQQGCVLPQQAGLEADLFCGEWFVSFHASFWEEPGNWKLQHIV